MGLVNPEGDLGKGRGSLDITPLVSSWSSQEREEEAPSSEEG